MWTQAAHGCLPRESTAKVSWKRARRTSSWAMMAPPKTRVESKYIFSFSSLIFCRNVKCVLLLLFLNRPIGYIPIKNYGLLLAVVRVRDSLILDVIWLDKTLCYAESLLLVVLLIESLFFVDMGKDKVMEACFHQRIKIYIFYSSLVVVV